MKVMSFVLAIAALAVGVTAGTAFEQNLLVARDKQDLAALEQVIAKASGEANAPGASPESDYRAALAYSYAAEVAMELHDKRKSAGFAESGLAFARKAEAAESSKAEFHRLTGQLCGQVIPANPIFGALKYGQCAHDEVNKALELDSRSALAYVSRGVGNYYLPESMGGGPGLAVQDFDKALALDPNLAEAYLWKGLALRKINRAAEAHAALDKAAALDPARVWTRQELEKTPAR